MKEYRSLAPQLKGTIYDLPIKCHEITELSNAIMVRARAIAEMDEVMCIVHTKGITRENAEKLLREYDLIEV